MFGIHPIDREPASPGERVGDPFAPLTTQLDDLGAPLGTVFEGSRQWVADLVDGVLELLPEERYTGAVAVFEEHVAEE